MDQSAADRLGPLTLRELVYDSGLGLISMTGDMNLDRQVRGIHSSELADPVPWMAGANLLTTTGWSFVEDLDGGLRLLDQLATIDSGALMIGTGHNFAHIPPELIDHAKELGVPVLQIPFGVRMRTIFSYVYNALASSDMHRLQRTVATQNQLLDLLAADSGEDELIAKVAGLIAMPVVLLDGQGRLVSGAGAGAEELSRLATLFWTTWSSAAKAEHPLGVLDAAPERYHYRDVVLYGKLERVVAAALRKGLSQNPEFADMALAFLQRLVALDLLKRRDELQARVRARQTLLREFLSGSVAAEDLKPWMDEERLDLRSPWRVILCDPVTSRGPGHMAPGIIETLFEATDAYLGGLGIPHLSGPWRMSLSILLPDPPDQSGGIRPLLQGLKRAIEDEPHLLPVVIGCSAAHVVPSEGNPARQEAREACQAAGRGVGSGGLVLFDEMSARFRLLRGQSPAVLTSMAQGSIGPLLDYDRAHHTQLLTTLRTLFDNGLAVQPTADALFLHRNSLQKRLRRIESLLDVDLKNLDDVMELYLGSRAMELIGEEAVTGGPSREVVVPSGTPS